ncbi:MAG: oligosaccharide flippase family protein [Mycobacteriales bacterium]
MRRAVDAETMGGGFAVPGGTGSELSQVEIRRRAVTGTLALLARGAAIRVLGLLASLVLVRLLAPRDFGAVALGGALLTFSTTIADGGLGAGLIRDAREPERRDLQAVLFAQLVALCGLGAVVVAVTYPLGFAGRVTALMMVALPVQAFRVPGTVLLERSLRYGPIVVTELVETVVFYGWAIATVLAGAGVWGLATAYPIRVVVGTATLLGLCRGSRMRPRPSWERIRELLAFGMRLQGIALTNMLRDLAVNIGTAAIVGISVLGLWSLAFRIMSVPFLLFDALWRVSFATMSRLVAARADMRLILSRMTSYGAVLTCCVLCPLAASSQALVPVVFGATWSAAAEVIPWACAGLIISGPVSVAASGYLTAVQDAQSVLRAVAVQSVVWLAVAFATLPVAGVAGVGIGWFAACLVESALLARAVQQLVPVGFARLLLAPAVAAIVGTSLGMALVGMLGNTAFAAGSSAGLSAVAFFTVLLVAQPALLREVLRFAARSGIQAMSRTPSREASHD